MMTIERTAVWEPPGPGEWEYDPSHSPPSPTLLMRRIGAESATTAYEKVFRTYGGPLKTVEVSFIHGKMFRRLVPLVGGDKNTKTPPAPILWAASRLHPVFRRQNRLAKRTLEQRLFLGPIQEWVASERQSWIDRNLAFQDQDLATMPDADLSTHIRDLLAHTLAGWTRHHELHGTDLGPIGDLLAHTNHWGLDPVVVMSALRGSSPATTEAAEILAEIAAAVVAAGVDLDDMEDLESLRAASPKASELLDDYLRIYGWRTVTSYDIEALTTIELPEATLSNIKAAARRPDVNPQSGANPAVNPEAINPEHGGVHIAGKAEADQILADLTQKLDPAHRDTFQYLMADARLGYGLRDDNGPLTAEWPMGLIRRAYLEAGRRLLASGRFERSDDAFELDGNELAAILEGTDLPDASEIAERRNSRAWEAGLEVPATLGPVSDPPSPTLLPSGLRRMSEAILTAVSLLEPEPTNNKPLTGLGIGKRVHVGRAHVAHSAEDVLATMESGDVLVAAWTAPTFNTVLTVAGAIVVQEGGLLCHAAVMARELDIPAVIGVNNAMTDITDGDLVEVDPVTGSVRILDHV